MKLLQSSSLSDLRESNVFALVCHFVHGGYDVGSCLVPRSTFLTSEGVWSGGGGGCMVLGGHGPESPSPSNQWRPPKPAVRILLECIFFLLRLNLNIIRQLIFLPKFVLIFFLTTFRLSLVNSIDGFLVSSKSLATLLLYKNAFQ